MKEEFDALFAEHQKLLGELQAMRAVKPAPVQDWKLVPVDARPEIMDAAIAVHDKWAWRNFPAMWEAMLAAAPQPAQQTCNCRWDGEVQVQQCTLHESHLLAIHEWAGRAKAAEAKLAEQPAPVQQEPEYTWPTVADYERDVGFETNQAFRMAWNMARTTNIMLGHTSPPAQHTWVGLIRGVRVEGDAVVITVKRGNDAARELCGALLKEKNT